ncbi:hypothetical protein ACFL04_00965 [Patescibacteria group bacterium]
MEEEKKEVPKKRHRLRLAIIIIVAVLLVLIIGIGATGLYSIPGISAVFGMNKPKDLGVETSAEDLASIKKKIPMKIVGDPADYASGADDLFSGTLEVDTSTNNEEITSWLQRFEGDDPIFSDVQVKKIEGGLEISTMLNRYIKAPVYVKVMVDQVATNTIDLEIDQAKLGIFTVPENYQEQAEEFFEDKINELMNEIPGFTMKNYEIHEGVSKFKGTFPAEVSRSRQGWSALLDL